MHYSSVNTFTKYSSYLGQSKVKYTVWSSPPTVLPINSCSNIILTKQDRSKTMLLNSLRSLHLDLKSEFNYKFCY